MFLVTVNPTLALTNSEKQKLFKDVQNVCIKYNKSCTVSELHYNKVNALTTRDYNIEFTTGILNKLSYNELFAVGLHEIGHIAHRHYKIHDIFYRYTTPRQYKEGLKTLKYLQETDADLFATRYYINNNSFNYLPDALRALAPEHLRNISSNTHPSINSRIEKIETYSKFYRSLKN